MRISDWSSDVCSSDLAVAQARADVERREGLVASGAVSREELAHARDMLAAAEAALSASHGQLARSTALVDATTLQKQPQVQAAASQLRQAYLNLQRASIVAPVSGYRSEEHTSELQSLMRISYAGFCLKKKKKATQT